MNPQTLDQDVVNLTKAIRQVESGGDINAAGKSGEKSLYQFLPDTWKAYSSDAGVNVPLEQATREQQNQVAYTKIKQWKDQGYNVGQVASMWNAGPGKPNAYQEGHKGVNQQTGVSYDTPNYAQKVAQAYQQIKTGGLGGTYQQPPQPKQFTPATTTGAQQLQSQLGAKEGGYLSQIGQDFTQLGQNINAATQNDYNVGSKTLQTAGAVTGAAGDVIDTTLSNLPVVGGVYKGATDLLGKAVGGAMEATGASEWMAEHPEAAGNIGAALDIASVVPFFKALKYGKAGMRDVATGVRSTSVEKGATNELKSSLTKQPTRALERAEKRGLKPMETIIKNKDYLPDVIESNGKFLYDTKAATQKIKNVIDADEKALQNLLASQVKQKGGSQIVGINLDKVKKTILDDLLPKGKINVNRSAIANQIDRIFSDISASAGRNFISLNELNDIKRQIRKGINFDAIDPTRALTKEVQFEAGQSVMKQIEKEAKKAGIKGIKDINQKMANDITALNILEFLDNRAVKTGPKTSLTKARESLTGLVPFYGEKANQLMTPARSTPVSKLKLRSPIPQTGKKGLVQLGGGLALSGQLSPEQK